MPFNMQALMALIKAFTRPKPPQVPKGEPLSYGELGILHGPHGVSSELMGGVQDPGLYGGRQTNIPLLAKGQVGVPDLLNRVRPTNQQWEIAIQRAIARIKQGQQFPNFATVPEAEADEARRHKILDTVADSIPQDRGLQMHQPKGK